MVCGVLFCPLLGRSTDHPRTAHRTQQKTARVGDVAAVGIEASVRAHGDSYLGFRAEVWILSVINWCPVMGEDQGWPGLLTKCVAVASINPAGSVAAGVVAVVVGGVSACIGG